VEALKRSREPPTGDASRPRSALQLKLDRAGQASEFAFDLVFLALIFVVLGIVVYLLFKGMLFLESGSQWWFGLLSLGVIVFVWSPAPNWIVTRAWLSYRRGVLRLLRNLVASALMLAAIANLVAFARTADFEQYGSLLELGMAIGRAMLGFD